MANAVFYNVIFWRDGARALDLWPREAQLRLTPQTLPRGEYTWFVYPALLRGKRHVYGPVAAHGQISI